MNSPALLSTEAEHALARLHVICPDGPDATVGFRLWDGTPWPDAVPRAATIVLKHPSALKAMFADGTEQGMAEAYLRDDFDVEGDIEAACALSDHLLHATAGNGWGLAAARLIHRRTTVAPALARAWQSVRLFPARRHTPERDRAAIAFHYDLSNDFFRLWLDPRMIYSCAYFERDTADLAEAQTAKLRHLCRKLRLQPGQRLLDIGCGWGGLALYAAQNHGVKVTAITLSRQQALLAKEQVAAARLEDRIGVRHGDYREVDAFGTYDAIVSVGMAEHVGQDNLPTYFRRAFRLLKAGGVFLNHAIGDGVRARHHGESSFIQRYVFPDAAIPPIAPVLAAAEGAGFEVRDVENLREHYALTLRHWVRRLEAKHVRALDFVNEPTYRVWRLYMAGSAHGFEHARLAVYQTLLAKPDSFGRTHLPLTRADWYAPAPESAEQSI
jgi:cyclopropane-fatty-acyl-phospholipid synthase